jgi:DNA primase
MATSAAQPNFEAERQEINDRLDIYDLVSRNGAVLRRSNPKRGQPTYKGLCPFHQEKTPSFVVYEHDNSYHCFGCGAHGDAISFIRDSERLDNKQAYRRAKELAGIFLPPRESREKRHAREKATGTPAGVAGYDGEVLWTCQEWQDLAEQLVREGRQRMTRARMEIFEKGDPTELKDFGRGLKPATVRRFEVGWTGETDYKTTVRIAGQERFFRGPGRVLAIPGPGSRRPDRDA